MARVVILGGGISGHTAALHLRRMLGKEHDVVVVSPNSRWSWNPSNIWVGVGKMTTERVTSPWPFGTSIAIKQGGRRVHVPRSN